MWKINIAFIKAIKITNNEILLENICKKLYNIGTQNHLSYLKEKQNET